MGVNNIVTRVVPTSEFVWIVTLLDGNVWLNLSLVESITWANKQRTHSIITTVSGMTYGVEGDPDSVITKLLENGSR